MDPEIIQGGLMQNMGMDEGTAFKGAIIPEDAGPLVTETLEKAGIKHIETYRTPEEREAAFSRFPELLFSAAGAGGIFLASQKPERTESPDGT